MLDTSISTNTCGLSDLLPNDHPFAGLQRNHYASIAADPPWAYRTRSKKGLSRSADRHYRTMSLDHIAELPVGDLAAKNCFLWLWVTGPFIAMGGHLPIMKAWGFKPSSLAFVWIKTNDHESVEKAQTWEEVLFNGMGFTTRQNAEVVILGRRGHPKRLDTTIRQVLISRRQEHSRKPNEIIRRIERFSSGPRLELFARTTRPDWAVWGNETDRFEE